MSRDIVSLYLDHSYFPLGGMKAENTEETHMDAGRSCTKPQKREQLEPRIELKDL